MDSDGFVYTSESVPQNTRVQVFDKNGNFVRMWGYGVKDGTSAFQVCTSGCQLGIQGSGTWQFHNPAGLAADPDNRIYVTDRSNDIVYKFDRSGNRLTKWSEANVDLLGPFGIAVDRSALYVVDSNHARVVKYVGPYFGTYVGEPELGASR